VDERPNSELVVEGFEDEDPVRNGFESGLQLLSDGVHRKQGTDALGQHVAQEFHPAQVPDLLGAHNVIPEHPLDFFVMPAPEKPRILYTRDTVFHRFPFLEPIDPTAQGRVASRKPKLSAPDTPLFINI
jgi:hypothetical protein